MTIVKITVTNAELLDGAYLDGHPNKLERWLATLSKNGRVDSSYSPQDQSTTYRWVPNEVTKYRFDDFA